MLKNFKFDYRYVLLLAIPFAFLAGSIGLGDVGQFMAAAVAIIPLAGFIGEATEELTVRTGPKIGGLLNATLGNAAELIITIVAIREGVLELVLASITGSILGNLLLVLGLSVLLGGLKNGRQTFNAEQATSNATMMMLAVVALLIPAVFGEFIDVEHHEALLPFSLGVAIVMIVIYGLGIYYSFTAQDADDPMSRESAHGHEAKWSVRTAVIVLAAATIAIVFMSELLVESVEHVVEQLGWSEFFVGIIIVPLVGNAAEHLVAVQVAMKNQMTLSMEIALGSSLQIALFVAPVLVIVAALMGKELALSFNVFEMVALASAGIVGVFVFKDGRSNWLEGAQLLALYILLGVAFFFV
ncbi:MAG: calcium/proton exchanger [Ardenticatenaceae bacterium]|nr:calcium/proton exchanger [Ardenticatenaceae bacterium]